MNKNPIKIKFFFASPKFRWINLFFMIFLTTSLHSEVIRVGISKSIPPYVFRDTNKGIEIEIFREALKTKGYELAPIFMSFKRTFVQLEEGQVDAILNIKKGTIKNAYYSDVVITFENVAISLKKKKYPEIFSFEFLADKHVIAFQQAHVNLGREFRQAIENNPNYQEYAEQSVQVNRLFLDRNADFIILEKRIFQQLRREAKEQLGDKVWQEVTYHHIFEPTLYRFAFRDSMVCADFNDGLHRIRKNGIYDQILQKYSRDLK